MTNLNISDQFIIDHFMSQKDHLAYVQQYGETNHLKNFFLKDKELFLYGSFHSFDPNHEQYSFIKNSLKNFLQKHEGEKNIVFIEGGNNWPLSENESEAIQKYGEPGFLTYLCNKHNTKTFSPELIEEEIVEKLSQKFPKKAIIYYFFARIIAHEMKKGAPIERVKDFGNNYLNKRGITQSFQDIHQEIFSEKDINATDWKRFADICDPFKKLSIINEICVAEDPIRDLFIIRNVLEYNQNGYNIFLVYGKDHIIMRMPFLDKLQNK